MKGIARAWQQPGNNMATSWQQHCNSMAIYCFCFLFFLRSFVFCFLLKRNPPEASQNTPQNTSQTDGFGRFWGVISHENSPTHTQTNSPTTNAHKKHTISSGLPPRTLLLLYQSQSLELPMFTNPYNVLGEAFVFVFLFFIKTQSPPKPPKTPPPEHLPNGWVWEVLGG